MSDDPKNLPGGWYDPGDDDEDETGEDNWWQMDRYDDEDDLEEWDDMDLNDEIQAFRASEEEKHEG